MAIIPERLPLYASLIPFSFWFFGNLCDPRGILGLYGYSHTNANKWEVFEEGMAFNMIQTLGLGFLLNLSILGFAIRLGNSDLLANVNLAFGLCYVYQALETCCQVEAWEKAGLTTSAVWSQFGCLMALALLHFLGTNWDNLRFSGKHLFSRMNWAAWVFILASFICGLWARSAPINMLEVWGLSPTFAGTAAKAGHHAITNGKLWNFCVLIMESLGSQGLQSAILVLFVILARDQVANYSLCRFLAYFGVIWFVWNAAATAACDLTKNSVGARNVQISNVPYYLIIIFGFIEIFAIDNRIRAVVEGHVGDKTNEMGIALTSSDDWE